MDIPILWQNDTAKAVGRVEVDGAEMIVHLRPESYVTIKMLTNSFQAVRVLESVKSHDGTSEYITKAKVMAFSIDPIQ